jgi:hypothetical protein
LQWYLLFGRQRRVNFKRLQIIHYVLFCSKRHFRRREQKESPTHLSAKIARGGDSSDELPNGACH